MSASPQSSRFLWLALALGSGAPALAQAPAPVASPFLPTAPYTLVGMSADPQETTVCIYVAKEKRSVWIPVGETNDGIDVVSFDVQKEQALIRTGSLKLLLTLQEAPGLRAAAAAPPNAGPAAGSGTAAGSAAAPSQADADAAKERQANRMLVSDLLVVSQEQRAANAAAAKAAGNP